MNAPPSMRDWLRIFGPAWLVMMADIDVASIVTGLQAGASWGYHMVFIMIALTLPLFVIQDAAGRLGTVGGLGLGEAISKYYGRKVAAIAALPMAVSDFLQYVAEYAGMAIGCSLIGFPVLLGLAMVYTVHTAIVVGRRYRQAEVILIPLSFVVVASIAVSTFFFPYDLTKVLSIGLTPLQPYGNPSFDFLMAASIGAVIMPWMLYFHSGADSRKKLKAGDLKLERMETLIGAIASEVLMAVIVLDGAHLSSTGNFVSYSSLAQSLLPLGANAPLVMGLGFIFAGFLALVVISLGSAWGVLEALRWKSKSSFLWVYALESLPAVLVVLLAGGYIKLMLNLMVIYTIIVIPSLFFLGRLISSPSLMNGKHYGRREMVLFWAMSASVVVGGVLGLMSFA
ncbi:MAG: divalent metal cation transporter [Conexivisphaerales archaeon]